MTMRSTRSGHPRASSWTTRPPKESPTSVAVSIPSSSMSRTTSPAKVFMVAGASLVSDRPAPRLSKLNTR